MPKSRWTHSVCDECYDKISGGEPASPHRLIGAGEDKCCVCGNQHASGIYLRIDPSKTLCKGVHPDAVTERVVKGCANCTRLEEDLGRVVGALRKYTNYFLPDGTCPANEILEGR